MYAWVKKLNLSKSLFAVKLHGINKAVANTRGIQSLVDWWGYC